MSVSRISNKDELIFFLSLVIQEKSLRIIVGTTAISPGTRPDSEKCVRNQQLVKNKTTIYESIFTCFGHSPTPTEGLSVYCLECVLVTFTVVVIVVDVNVDVDLIVFYLS